jgi:predicted RecA/RadA family phage recombinase
MPQATYVHEGELIDYTPGSAVAAGEVVVQGELVGVVARPLAAGEAGAILVWGVFDFAKNTGVAYTVGTILYWDDTNNVVTATATGNKQIGKTIRAAASADTTVRVRLSQ